MNWNVCLLVFSLLKELKKTISRFFSIRCMRSTPLIRQFTNYEIKLFPNNKKPSQIHHASDILPNKNLIHKTYVKIFRPYRSLYNRGPRLFFFFFYFGLWSNGKYDIQNAAEWKHINVYFGKRQHRSSYKISIMLLYSLFSLKKKHKIYVH